MDGGRDGGMDGFVWSLRTKNTFPMSTCVTKHRCVDQSDTSQLEEELMSLLYSTHRFSVLIPDHVLADYIWY